MNNAPVNSLSEDLVVSFKEQFPKLVNDPKVKAIVVTGAGNFFCGGAEISEFAKIVMGGPESFKDPNNGIAALSHMMDMIDGSPKTVVAAVNGQALGGGLEVALACHYRVASPKAAVGFPEVQLGLLPGGQGTQRLPRVCPLPAAIPLILQGAPMKAPQALKVGLVDALAKEDVLAEAAAFALKSPPHPISKRPVPHANRFMGAAGAFEQALLMASISAPGMIAPEAIVTCLRAACSKMTFQEGLVVEQREFGRLLFSVQSAAMRNLFFAERMATKLPGVRAKPAKVKSVGIVGAGLMGGGIAMCFIQKGIPVVIKDAKQEWLDAGVAKVLGMWQGQVKKGRMKEEEYKKRVGMFKPTLNFEDFKDVDMVIEAVPEIMDLKKEVFLALDKHTKPDCCICTNTSGLNIDDIASVLKDPSRCMGAHFFSPANVMPLLENIRTAKASEQTLATGMAMGKLIGKKAVLAGNCDGFIGNRMIAPYASEAKQLVEEGAGFEQLDMAATDFGMAMGPMALGDLVGQELFWKQRKAAGDMNKQTKTYMGPYELVDWLCENNRFGQKTPDPKIKATGRGIFIHRGPKDKSVDPEVIAKMDEIRKMKGVTPRKVSNEEIVERLFFPLINEGFRILEEGYAERSSDIDIVYIFGYGFPPAKGGPMFFSEHYVGFSKIVERLQVYGAQAKERFKQPWALPVDYFEPSKLLLECAARQAKKEQVPPGFSLIDMVLAEKRLAGSPQGPASKL